MSAAPRSARRDRRWCMFAVVAFDCASRRHGQAASHAQTAFTPRALFRLTCLARRKRGLMGDATGLCGASFRPAYIRRSQAHRIITAAGIRGHRTKPCSLDRVLQLPGMKVVGGNRVSGTLARRNCYRGSRR